MILWTTRRNCAWAIRPILFALAIAALAPLNMGGCDFTGNYIPLGSHDDEYDCYDCGYDEGWWFEGYYYDSGYDDAYYYEDPYYYDDYYYQDDYYYEDTYYYEDEYYYDDCYDGYCYDEGW